jgi:hypothetical protein
MKPTVRLPFSSHLISSNHQQMAGRECSTTVGFCVRFNFKRIICLALFALTSTSAATIAQENAFHDEKPKMFFGITRGNLLERSYPDLQSFIAIQGLVHQIKSQLEQLINIPGISEVTFWDPDDRSRNDELTSKGYTHYLIARPDRSWDGRASIVRVTWTIGRIWRTGAGIGIFDADLKHMTILKSLTIKTNELPVPMQKRSGEKDYEFYSDDSFDVVTNLQTLFSELRRDQLFFVDCFERVRGLPQESPPAAEEQELATDEAKIMAYLSRYLAGQAAGGQWHSSRQFNRWADAMAMCSNESYKKDEAYTNAYFHIYGHIDVIRDIAAPKFTIPLEILDRTYLLRDNVIRDRRSDYPRGFPVTPEALESFCTSDTAFSPTTLKNLAEFIAVNGFHIKDVMLTRAVACDAR